MGTVYMFLPDGSNKQREDKPFRVLPYATIIYLKARWYKLITGNRLQAMETYELPKHIQLWCLIMGIKQS